MIDAFLEEQLTTSGLSRTEFSEVLVRLLDYGVISRDESQIEASLYDRYQLCADLVEDYLAVIGVRIQHDRQFAFVRIFPPGAEVPGMTDLDSAPFNNGFRSKPSQQEVALILVLRTEYEKSLREGQVDEKGRAMLSMEGLAIAMHNLLKRALPEGQMERKTLFRRLRQLRLVDFNGDDEMDSEESWLCIQPSITSFVTDEVLDTLLGEPNGEEDSAAEESGGDDEDDNDAQVTPSALFSGEEH